jgi:hypothetical protein
MSRSTFWLSWIPGTYSIIYNMVNRDESDKLAKYLADVRYKENNYFEANNLMASSSLEWVIKGLKSRLETCMNAESGVCDIWYLESHSDCLLLMNLIYEYSADPLYDAKLK